MPLRGPVFLVGRADGESMNKFYGAGYVRKNAAAITDYLADEKAGLIYAATKSLKPGKDAEMASSTGQQQRWRSSSFSTRTSTSIT